MKLVAGLGIAIVAGVVIYSVVGKGLTNNSSVEKQGGDSSKTSNSKSSDTVNPSGSYSINELLTMNKPLKCTWKESASGDKDVTNLIYINGMKFYQDVTMADIGHSFTISDGDYLYIWSDFNDVASKIKNTGAKTNLKTDQGAAGQEQKKDFLCEKWTVDNSVFKPPQDKNFKDVTDEMNEGFKEMGESGGLEKAKQQMCDLCQNAPDQEAIDNCLKNAECN
jgi:hypothetical protein